MSIAIKAEVPTWHPTLTAPAPIKIIRATHLGMCFGVRDAIDLALEPTRAFNHPGRPGA